MHKDKHKLRRYVARAATISSVAVTAALLVGAGVASAAPADPTGGANPVAPHFYNGNVEQIRGSGSDTTFFMMQRISDLFTGAGLYGCTLNADNATNFNTSDPAPSTSNEFFFCSANANIDTTDVNDNWDRTEVAQGVDDVGSGAGQGQLCGSIDTPPSLPVDFARSSKPAGSITGCNMVETGYAKDGVPIIDYPVNPSSFGTPATSVYSSINGGVVGPVASGWLPGDSPTAATFSGTKLTNIANNDNGGGANSTAYRLWCAKNNGSTVTNQITDWGQLTNIGPNLLVDNVTTNSGSPNVTISSGTFPSTVVAGDAVTGTGIPSGTTVSSGSGTATLTLSNNASATGTPNLNFATTSKLAVGQGLPVGIPVRIMGVNGSSGTEFTFQNFAESGVSGQGCASDMNANAANDPNPATAPTPNSGHIALENNSDQIDEFALGDFPGTDFADQAIEAATTLYIESNGVFNTNPYAGSVTINKVTIGGSKLNENGQGTTTPNLLNNIYPTARTLFNIYNSSTVRGSTGGFLNWICDGNTNFNKGLDNTTGGNFDAELSTLIGTTFGFPRLTDEATNASIAQPADNVPAPNTTCSASLPVTATSGQSTITLTGGGSFPSDIVNATKLASGGSVGIISADFPAGTTVVSGAGTSTLTLSNAASASGSVATNFLGVPAVQSVESPQN
jgi:hypothetical protein